MMPFGRYLLLEKLAMGGMAEVWLARSADGGKPIVLKRILPQFATDPEFVARFREEAEISLSLVHGNIVPVFEVGTVGEDAYIAMEYLPGVDLRSVLRKAREDGARVPPGIAAWIIAEVLRGLDYAHRKNDDRGHPLGLVHRDVSPSNVVVSREGAVKLLDFGIAKAFGREATRTGVLRGKVGYMSPEQARGDALGAESDLFSTGVVLYELLTGEKLFDGESEAAILERVKSAPIPRAREKNPQIPQGLDAVVGKALQRDPLLRYSHAAEFLDALCRVLYGGELPVVDAAAASGWIRGLFPAGEGSAGLDADHRTATRAPVASQIGPGAALMLGGGSMPVAAQRPSRAPLWAVGGAILGVAVAVPLFPILRPAGPSFVPGVSTVVVQSTIPGSTILVDNVDSGQTPTVLTVSRAQHRILVRHDGYQDIEKTVEVAMAPLEENFRQEPLPRKISFTTQPEGAVVTVEGHGYCTTPCELAGFLPDETVLVSAEKPLFRSATGRAKVAETHGAFSLRLDPLPAVAGGAHTPIVVAATPTAAPTTSAAVVAKGTASFAARPWGILSIDGGPESSTPLQGISLVAGPHKLHITNDAFHVDQICPFEIGPGLSRPLAVIFVDRKPFTCPQVESPPSN